MQLCYLIRLYMFYGHSYPRICMMNTKISHSLGFASTIMTYVPISLTCYTSKLEFNFLPLWCDFFFFFLLSIVSSWWCGWSHNIPCFIWWSRSTLFGIHFNLDLYFYIRVCVCSLVCVLVSSFYSLFNAASSNKTRFKKKEGKRGKI